jgi:hypothetical protein
MNVAPPIPPAAPHTEPHPGHRPALDPHAYNPAGADHLPDPESPGVRTRHPLAASVSIMIAVCLVALCLALVALL